MPRFFIRFIALLILCLPSFATAGSSQATAPKWPEATLATFSNRVQQDLAARGANVAIVARMGRDPSVLPDGVIYTHVALWVYSNITRADGRTGRGYNVYNLYQDADNASHSSLVQDRPVDFFAGAHRLDAGVVIPDIRLQKKLLKVIASPTYKALHNPRYSVLSNPDNTQFQNCTEHTLDVMMASLYNTRSKAQIKANINAYFTPQPIAVSGMKRALATIASPALTTVDHGDTIATATFTSIAGFMEDNKLSANTYRITPTAVRRF